MRFHLDGSSEHEFAHLCPEVLCSQYPRREGDGAARSGVRARPVRWAGAILTGVDPVAVLGLPLAYPVCAILTLPTLCDTRGRCSCWKPINIFEFQTP